MMHKVFSLVGSSTKKEMYLQLDEIQGRWPDVTGVGEGQITMASCTIESFHFTPSAVGSHYRDLGE